MKSSIKFLVVALAIITFTNVQAQTEQGSILVGASTNLGFNSTKHKDADDATNNFVLDAQAGYFVIDDLAVGLGLGFDNESTGDFKDNTFDFGLFGRYYINSAIIVGANYSYLKNTVDDGSDEVESKGSAFGLEAGYAVFLGENVAVEPTISYDMGLSDALEDINSFGINVGFSLYF
ncbi:outer membrane beta-barrel protein [Reichenbachiella versicolor]|uniref:outer membrane beta-barrel protein n=1 Tax=Reichenbachiella versicolor TaxID=1821036 RepID=UPI000D6E3DA3|nr:outer membrane beta-barrel protein [Reichenbachiella versicolor]